MALFDSSRVWKSKETLLVQEMVIMALLFLKMVNHRVKEPDGNGEMMID